jgi:hypothetical protein
LLAGLVAPEEKSPTFDHPAAIYSGVRFFDEN